MSLRLNTPLPSLEGAAQWINGKPDLKEAQGAPLLIHFWAVSCHICHENMPKLEIYRKKYVPKGLIMIAIHCPRMKTDTDIEKVKQVVERYQISEPCGIDNLHKIKKTFDNDIWPAYFLFDQTGKLKRRAAGKAGLVMITPYLEKIFKVSNF